MGYGDDITGAKDSLDTQIKTASSFSADNVHFDYKRTLHYDEDRVQCRGRFMRDTVTAIGPAETQHILTFRLEISYQGTGIEDDLDEIIDYVGEIVDVIDSDRSLGSSSITNTEYSECDYSFSEQGNFVVYYAFMTVMIELLRNV